MSMPPNASGSDRLEGGGSAAVACRWAGFGAHICLLGMGPACFRHGLAYGPDEIIDFLVRIEAGI